ncbi:MAG: FHA domain-containing protein [Chitinispirillaceae bacterium]
MRPTSETADLEFRFPLDGTDRIIGRDHACDLRLSGVGVSRRHALLRCDSNRPLIIDSDSTFGIRLDGIPLNEGVLENGSLLTIGIRQFRVDLGDESIRLKAVEVAESEMTVSQVSEEIRIGRAPENDICLNHPMVSRFHALVRKTAEGLVIADQGSSNSTFVNGQAVGNAVLNDGDVVHVGPYRLYVSGGALERADDPNRIRIEVVNLGVRIKGKALLDDLSMTVEPGAFLAVLGVSGAGKSTLSRVLSGQLSPTSGRLYMNGFPMERFRGALLKGIGYVSQTVLLRPELTIWETLVEQALIRLPHDSTNGERLVRAGEILDLVELGDVRDSRVGSLSGGEARRLHIGVELLASPALVILDEPLAGLDPGLVKRLMDLFRRICDRGHTLVLTTHTLERIDLCDRVVFINSGKLLYSGAPEGLCDHFGEENLARVYEKAAALKNSYKQSEWMLSEQETAISVSPPSVQQKRDVIQLLSLKSRAGSVFRQFKMLLSRYMKIHLRDRRNMILLLAQAPLIALLLGLVYRGEMTSLPVSFYFCLVIAGVWIGGLDTVREVAREWMLLFRESKCGMHLLSYLSSRVGIAAFLSAVQAFLFAVSLAVIFRHVAFSTEILVLLFFALFSGNLLGLVISSWSGTVGRAISALPLVLIPQIFFSGVLVPFDHMSGWGRFLSHLTVSRPVFGMMKKVFVLKMPLSEPQEWMELLFLCTGLIIIFAVALIRRLRRAAF